MTAGFREVVLPELPITSFEEWIAADGAQALERAKEFGVAGFIVYEESACVVDVAAVLSRFLYVESCGQGPPCQLGTCVIRVLSTTSASRRFGNIPHGRA